MDKTDLSLVIYLLGGYFRDLSFKQEHMFMFNMYIMCNVYVSKKDFVLRLLMIPTFFVVYNRSFTRFLCSCLQNY